MGICSDCHAGCCRSFAVPMTGADVIQIVDSQQKTFWEFGCRWADPEGMIARNYAPHFHFADEPRTQFVICLRHVESEQHPGTSRCIFLKEESPSEEVPLGRAGCSIYESRPAACRVFPVKFNQAGELPIIYDVPPRGRPGTEPVYDLCPRQWTKQDVDPIQSMQDLAIAKHEMIFFNHVAQIWNQRPAEWEVFPEFLKLVYQNRVLEERDLAQEFPSYEFQQPATVKFPVIYDPPAESRGKVA